MSAPCPGRGGEPSGRPELACSKFCRREIHYEVYPGLSLVVALGHLSDRSALKSKSHPPFQPHGAFKKRPWRRWETCSYRNVLIARTLHAEALLVYPFAYLPPISHLPTYLPTFPPTYLPTYLPSLPTYLPHTYLPTYRLDGSIHQSVQLSESIYLFVEPGSTERPQ